MAGTERSGIDYYAVLDVASSASQGEILAAWRKLARKWHPDLHPGDDLAHERMQLINEAKEVLGHEANRRRYDRECEASTDGRGARERDGRPFTSPEAVDFGTLDSGSTSGMFQISILADAQPSEIAVESDHGSFWHLAEDAYYVPLPDEQIDPREFLQIRIVAEAPATPVERNLRDTLVVKVDTHRLEVPLSVRVRVAKTADDGAPPRRNPPAGGGVSPPHTRPRGHAPASKESSPVAPELGVLFLVLAHAAPVGALVAQAGLQNPGAAAAIPIWLVGFSCGLTAWALARFLMGSRSDWLGTYLDTPIPYLIVGFVLWVIFGFALYS